MGATMSEQHPEQHSEQDEMSFLDEVEEAMGIGHDREPRPGQDEGDGNQVMQPPDIPG
jgi:hypothetical protein